MAWYRIAENVLDAIADAINDKTGGTSPMTPVEMVLEIQSIPTGGGGGFTKIGEYTQAEDWSTDALGNALNFRNTYLPSNLSNGIYIANILNNTKTGMYGQQLTLFNNVTGMDNYSYPRRYGTMGTSISSGTSFYMASGAVIKVYFVDGSVLT